MARAAGGGGRSRSGLSLRATFVLVSLASILPFLGLIVYFGYGQVAQEKGRVQEEALTAARTLAAQVENHVSARLDALTALADGLGSGGITPAAAEQAARRYRLSYPDFDQVVVVDQVGGLVAAAGQPLESRRGLGDQDWFKRAATSTQPFVGEPRQAAQDLVLGVYAPIRAPDSQLRGVVAADLNLRRIQGMLSRVSPRSGAVAQLVTEGGIVLARHPAPILVTSVQSLPGYGALLGKAETTTELTFDDGERRLAASAPVRPVSWAVAVGLPSAQVLADGKTLLAQVVGAGAAAAVLGFALALMAGRRAASGMGRLRAAMSRLEAGDIPVSVPVTTGGEVGALTEGFNRVLGWLRSKFREYEALSQVEEAAGAAIGSDRSASAVLPDLLRKVVGGMGADVGVLLIQEEAGLVTRAGVGFGGASVEGVTFRRGQGLGGAVVGGRETIVVQDVDADYRVEEPYIKAAGLRSLVAVPIVSGDRAIGAVEVGYRQPHTFSDVEMKRLEAMARRTAQAVEHERALDHVRRNTEGLEAKLAEQMEALHKAAAEQAEAKRQAQEARRQTAELQQTIRMQVSQVKEVIKADPAAEEAKRVRAALEKTVSEELRVPLAALLDLPRYLVDGLDKPLDREAQQQLEILHTRGEEIIELIDNLAVLSALHGGQLKVTMTPLSLPDLIQKVVRAVQPRAAARGNRIVIVTDAKSDAGRVASDARRLEQVLTNLLVTAAKYTELGEIRVSGSLKGNEVVVVVADDGAGFTPEEQARLFQPFLHVAPRGGRQLPGTGLLLTVGQKLVQQLGGKIAVQSEVDRGTSFTVSLPAKA
jgi:signal transduction histidine kinase/HAMP domain-containing protein